MSLTMSLPKQQHPRYSQKLPGWEEMANAFGVRICPGPPQVECGASVDQHRMGFVKAEDPPTVHWKMVSSFRARKNTGYRIVTRKGAYIFLKLCYRALNPETWHLPKWRQIYEESRAAVAAGLSIGVRIGRNSTELDRAKVKFALSDPASRDTTLKEQAWRWSEKRYD